MNIETIKSMVNDTLETLQNNYNIFRHKKSIIICGNGINYSSYTPKLIDSYDLVVRINNFITKPLITGTKKDILFCGATVHRHLLKKDFYPEINNFNHLFGSRTTISFLQKIIHTKPNITYYDPNQIQKINKKYGYRKHYGISGIHCSLMFLAIAKKYNIQKINFVGFDTDNDQRTQNLIQQKYYYGTKNATKEHYENHDWLFHDKFFDIIYDYYNNKYI